MKCFMVVLSLAVTTYARPDVSHIPSGSYLPGVGIGGIGNIGGGGYNYNQGSFITGGSNIFGGNIGGGFIGGQGIGGGGLQHDQKHVYFYAAPDEYEQSRLRIYVAPNSARNTKIIFVKAPSYGSLRPEIIAPPSQTEDKTLVYVLVKKPENGGSITIPSTLTSRPSKPEVYFIKYKTQQEAEQAVQGGLQEQAVGPSVPDLGNEQSFVRTLKDDISSGIGGIGNIGIGGGNIGIGGGSIGIGGGDISGPGGSVIGTIGTGGKYGPPGASGPYRR